MLAEIISIGDELTSGQRLDTNTQWLSQQLNELGIQTIRHTTVADNLELNIETFRRIILRAQVVICTGGLGPTQDDLTRQAIAAAFGLKLELDQDSLATIQAMFSRRGREMPESNRIQATFPSGSRVIPNPHGTAPGIELTVETRKHPSRIFALPGVPAEMKQMWHETVVPRLEETLEGQLGGLRHHSIKLFGIGESDVESKLPNLIARDRQPLVGITVSRATITLRIAVRARTDEDFQALIAPTCQEIHAALGDLVFGENEDELEHAVMRLLTSQGLSAASVEVGGSSWVNDWLLRAAYETAPKALENCGDSPRYLGGLCFPTLALAQQWLNIDSSEEEHVWKGLAASVRQRAGADIGLAIGIYPTRRQMELADAACEFIFAVATRDGVKIQRRWMGGHPDVLGPRIAKSGLDFLRRELTLLSSLAYPKGV